MWSNVLILFSEEADPVFVSISCGTRHSALLTKRGKVYSYYTGKIVLRSQVVLLTKTGIKTDQRKYTELNEITPNPCTVAVELMAYKADLCVVFCFRSQICCVWLQLWLVGGNSLDSLGIGISCGEIVRNLTCVRNPGNRIVEQVRLYGCSQNWSNQ